MSDVSVCMSDVSVCNAFLPTVPKILHLKVLSFSLFKILNHQYIYCEYYEINRIINDINRSINTFIHLRNKFLFLSQ